MTTGIKLDEAMKERLQMLGEKIERSPHWIMKKAIEEYLDQQERYWQEREEDQQRWEEYILTGEHVPHSEVSTWLDSIIAGEDKPCPA